LLLKLFYNSFYKYFLVGSSLTTDHELRGYDFSSASNLFRDLFFYPLRPAQELDDVQIEAAQEKIRKQFDFMPQFVMFSPTVFHYSSDFLCNPQTTREHQIVQVIHVPGHWVTITNCRSDEEIVPGSWYLYDSLNNADYIPHLKTALKKLDHEMDRVIINHVVVPSQLGSASISSRQNERSLQRPANVIGI